MISLFVTVCEHLAFAKSLMFCVVILGFADVRIVSPAGDRTAGRQCGFDVSAVGGRPYRFICRGEAVPKMRIQTPEVGGCINQPEAVTPIATRAARL